MLKFEVLNHAFVPCRTHSLRPTSSYGLCKYCSFVSLYADLSHSKAFPHQLWGITMSTEMNSLLFVTSNPLAV